VKYATIINDGRISFGPIVGDELIDLSHAVPTLAEALDGERRGELSGWIAGGQHVPLESSTFLPPIPRPNRILCIGINYATHAAESDRTTDTAYPVVFTRFASSLVGHEQHIVRPHVSDKFDYEGELAVVIGRRCRYVARDRALDIVAGYSCFMDGTLRDFQRHTTQFTPGKTFEQSGSFGPSIVDTDEVADPSRLMLRTLVNGEELQSACTSDLIHDIPALIAYCSTFTVLEPGDVIATGTPGGVGYARTPPRFLVPGDTVEVVVDDIGTLRNLVVDET
jgi:2-keto-4-pentenoate hydratase/2-oxohepta-3-ene-1,7-dioic acid hydratase in catechol pathway